MSIERILVNTEYMFTLSRQGLSGDSLRVLLCLLGNVQYDNKIKATQKEMADQLGMEPSNFTRCVSKLVKLGAVRRDGKVGVNQNLSLNPNLAWKGKKKDHMKALVVEIETQAT